MVNQFYKFRALVKDRYLHDGDKWHPYKEDVQEPIIIINVGILYRNTPRGQYSLFIDVDRIDLWLGVDENGEDIYEHDNIRYYFENDLDHTYFKTDISLTQYFYLHFIATMMETEVVIIKSDAIYA